MPAISRRGCIGREIIAVTIWPASIVLVLLVALFYFGRPLKNILEEHRQYRLLEREKESTKLLERRSKLHDDELTAVKRAELKNAELEKKAAEVRAAAIREETLQPIQLEEATRLIRATTDARIAAAEAQAAEGSLDGPAYMESLARAYEAYCKAYPSYPVSFDKWLGGRELPWE